MMEARKLPPKPLNRTHRQRLVIGLYLGYALIVAFWTLSSQLKNPWPMAFVVISAAGIFYAFRELVIRHGFWVLANAPDTDLDERQVKARDNAYRLSYALFSSLAALGILYWYLATDAKKLGLWLPSTSNELNAVFWGVWLLMVSLPTAVLAWTEPDPVRDEPTRY